MNIDKLPFDERIFDNIRPYNDSELPAALKRIAESEMFSFVADYVFPDINVADLKCKLLKINTIKQFQEMIMHPAIWSIVQKTSDGLSCKGFEKLQANKAYMFVCNHRDILLDAAILQILLLDNCLDTTEITFGSNLMQGELVVDIGKSNKMFRIIRGGNIHDFYRNSLEVSAYMRHVVLQKRQSVWIAQRNGRTKDGNDKTDMGVLKMLSLSSKLPFVENLKELNITPITVSYEYEPCDFLKTAELYVSGFQKYEKATNEDLMSILHGIRQQKGKIHFAVGDTITEQQLKICDQYSNNDKFRALSNLFDKAIYKNYKLFKTNYIAYDLLHNCSDYSQHYSVAEKNQFLEYMNVGLSKIDGEFEELKALFFKIYAGNVINSVTNSPPIT
ncbi:MAG: acyltransferase [Bacteroidales bacterium]|jgi:hypothetical protein|nr:acyltransferase [Bacteroidales bacterium]